MNVLTRRILLALAGAGLATAVDLGCSGRVVTDPVTAGAFLLSTAVGATATALVLFLVCVLIIAGVAWRQHKPFRVVWNTYTKDPA